ncbi:MAG: trypsin-like peptidase domain-containing protein [Bacillota bacterium]|nr:trypsin-like peptidase domain-containing protein [Bacillota bacterium]
MKSNYDYAKESRIHNIYGTGSTQVNRPPNKIKKLLAAIGFVILVSLISIASCAAYLAATGHLNTADNSGYKVNQVSSSGVTSVSSSGNGVLSTPDIIQKVLPSVVGITTATASGAGSGSGIVFSEDGYIVTNQHVIKDAISITATLSDGTEHEAALVGQDERTDLAVIKINANNLTAAEIGNSDELVQGETVLVIGNPLGETLSGSTTQGIVSALGREIEVEGRIMHYLQTDAAVNPGNSGGPLVNAAGLVVGVTSAKISSSYTEGLGFAIPINEAVPVIEELINNGYVTGRPIIGISGENVSAQVSAIYKIPEGVYVRYIDPDSGAYKAGIQPGDVITALNGKEIKTISELNNERDNFSAGDTVTLTVFRSGNVRNIDVVLGEASNSN